MKIPKIIIIILISCSSVIAQMNCDSNVLRSKLNSSDKSMVLSALLDIQLCKPVELIPDLEAKFYSTSDINIAFEIVNLLNDLNSGNTVKIANHFFENAHLFNYSISPLGLFRTKLMVLRVLFDNNDYSHANFLFEYFNVIPNELMSWQIGMLDKIIKYVPELETIAKNKILEIINSETKSYFIVEALEVLKDNYGSAFTNKYIELLEHPDWFVRITAIDCLYSIKYSNLREILQRMMLREINSLVKLHINRVFIQRLVEPLDIKFIQDYIRIEPVDSLREILNVRLLLFNIPRPKLSTTEMINNLINYNTEMYGYRWIKEENLYGLFDGSLNKIKEYYRRPDLENLCREIFMLNDRIETSRNEDKITTEAYKFLHYHLQYIKENVETELGNCQQ